MSGPRHASPASVAPAEARAIVEAFFDALGHFAGERPALDALAQMLAPEAEIRDVEEGRGDRGIRHDRDGWLSEVEEGSRRLPSALGQFFEEVACEVRTLGSRVHVDTVVDVRLTQGRSVQRVDTLSCEMVVERIGEHASIVQVTVRRSSRPPPQ